jgi:hypothetical protein
MSDVELERRVAAALHSPVSLRDGARDRIMRRVRESARDAAPRRRTLPLASRSPMHSFIGLAMAASIGSVAVLSTVTPRSASIDGEHRGAIGDSVVGALRDTLILMRLIHDGEHRYAFVVDGARWEPHRGTLPPRAGDRLVPLVRVARDSN